MVSGKKPVKDGKPSKVVKSTKQKRPNNFWAPFTAWWRAHYDETGHRASAAAIRDWYAENARGAWPGDQLPGIEDLLNVAKGMRTKAQVQSYFRKYRRSIKSRQDDSADTDVDATEEPPPDLSMQQMPFPGVLLGGPSQGHFLTAALEAAMKTDIGLDASLAATGAMPPGSFAALGLQPSAASIVATLQYQATNSQLAGQLPALLASPAAQLQLASLLFNRQAIPAGASPATVLASLGAPNAGQQPLLPQVTPRLPAPEHGGMAALAAAAAAQSSAAASTAAMQGPIGALLAAIGNQPRVHSALPSPTTSPATAAQGTSSASVPVVSASLPSRKASVRHPQLPWTAGKQGQLAIDTGAGNLGTLAEIADYAYVGQALGMDSPADVEGASDDSLVARHQQQVARAPSAGNPQPAEDISEPSALGLRLDLLGGPRSLDDVGAVDSIRQGSVPCQAGERLAEERIDPVMQASEASRLATPSCLGTGDETDLQRRTRSSSAAVASPAERGITDAQRTAAEPTPLPTVCNAASALQLRPAPAAADLVPATHSDVTAQVLNADQGQNSLEPLPTLQMAAQKAFPAGPALLALPAPNADQEIGTRHLTGEPSKQPQRVRSELARPRPPTHFLRDPAACGRVTANAAGKQLGGPARTGAGLADISGAMNTTTDAAAGKRPSGVPGSRAPYPVPVRNAAKEERPPQIPLQATRALQPGAMDDDGGQRAGRTVRTPFENRGTREPVREPASAVQHPGMHSDWTRARSAPGSLGGVSETFGQPRSQNGRLPQRHAAGHPTSQITSSVTTADGTSSGVATDDATSSEELEQGHGHGYGLDDTAFGNGNGHQRAYGSSFTAAAAPAGYYVGLSPAKRRRSGLGADVAGPSCRNRPTMDREEACGWRVARDAGAFDDRQLPFAAHDDDELQGPRATIHRAPSRQERGGNNAVQLPRLWFPAEDPQPASRHSSASQFRLPFMSARYGRPAAHVHHEDMDTGEQPAVAPSPAARNTLHAHLANIYADPLCPEPGASQQPPCVPPLESGSTLKSSVLVAMKYMNWATAMARPQGVPSALGPPGLPVLWRSLMQSDLMDAYTQETNGIGLNLESSDGAEMAAERYLAWVLKQEVR